MNEHQDVERLVRICRPAFQDFHRILPRFHARTELNRQLEKLRWWNPNEPVVIDLVWNSIPSTNMCELIIEPSTEFGAGIRVLFFELLSSAENSVWVLGGLELEVEFDEVQHRVYHGRSIIVKERALT